MNENQNETMSEELEVNFTLLKLSHFAGRLTEQDVDYIVELARQGLQLRKADAEADDFAEKLNKYVRKGEHGIFETLDNLTAELEALRKDKERLERALGRIGFFFAGTDQQHIADKVLLVINQGKTIDEAISINSAMEMEKSV